MGPGPSQACSTDVSSAAAVSQQFFPATSLQFSQQNLDVLCRHGFGPQLIKSFSSPQQLASVALFADEETVLKVFDEFFVPAISGSLPNLGSYPSICSSLRYSRSSWPQAPLLDAFFMARRFPVQLAAPLLDLVSSLMEDPSQSTSLTSSIPPRTTFSDIKAELQLLLQLAPFVEAVSQASSEAEFRQALTRLYDSSGLTSYVVRHLAAPQVLCSPYASLDDVVEVISLLLTSESLFLPLSAKARMMYLVTTEFARSRDLFSQAPSRYECFDVLRTIWAEVPPKHHPYWLGADAPDDLFSMLPAKSLLDPDFYDAWVSKFVDPSLKPLAESLRDSLPYLDDQSLASLNMLLSDLSCLPLQSREVFKSLVASPTCMTWDRALSVSTLMSV